MTGIMPTPCPNGCGTMILDIHLGESLFDSPTYTFHCRKCGHSEEVDGK